jgi:eukaryotic-like serine/threonine-protein kinase
VSTGAPALALPQRGTVIDRFEIMGTASLGRNGAVLQAREDAGSYVALKLATTRVGAQLVEHEGRVLRALAADTAGISRLAGAGFDGEQPWSASSWMGGVGVRAAAAELRDERPAPGLLALCGRVARRFAALHAQGVVHGQVHPRHVLVDRDGSVALIDLSVAASASENPPPSRLEARFGSLGAPEQASSLLRGGEVALTAAAEQYSVAALLYLLVTGRMYARLRLEREVLPRDIVDASPAPFSAHGLPASPELEAVLGRALEHDPAHRYGSMAELAGALEALAPSAPACARARVPASAALSGALETFRREASADDAIASLVAPTCSINFGATGVAFALTRLGTVTRDASAFAQAERWLAAAEQLATNADAFDDGDQLTARTIGTVSPFHTVSGLATARAFLSRATGDQAREQAALEEFLETTAAPCANLDLTLGRSSVLLVAALLLAGANRASPVVQRLAARGDELCAGIWRDAADEQLVYHGIAHGWAGLAYATMMWSQARGVEPPVPVRGVLEGLARLAEPWERGARWPVSPPDGPSPGQFWPGWCHGNAGYVFLWNLAEGTYGDGVFAELAGRAAWLTDGVAGVTSLCCGTAGQAYAALNQYRSTGNARWLAVGTRLAERGAGEDALAGDATTPLSLYKGHVGLALLAAELECPERAAMPLFEFEPAQT